MDYSYFSFFSIGLVAGFIDAIAGGAGLITIPSLLFFGFPPDSAVATSRFGSLGMQLSAFYAFLKKELIQWKLTIPLSILAFFGAIIGAHLLIDLPTDYFLIAFALVLLVIGLIFLRGKDLGIHQEEKSFRKKCFGGVLFFLVLIFGSAIGAGTGPILFYISVSYFGLTMLQTSATCRIPAIVMSVTSLAIFAAHDIIHYQYGLSLLLGMSFGAYMGANQADMRGNIWARSIFLVILVASGAKVLIELSLTYLPYREFFG